MKETNRIAASNCAGGFATTPLLTMRAFDALPPKARRAVALAAFNWATQPMLHGLRAGCRRFGSERKIVSSVRRMDLEKFKADGSVEMEYAVIAEKQDGTICTLRRGFTSARAAEDHPIILSEWRRVWVAPIGMPTTPKESHDLTEVVVPPKPWDWIASGAPTANGTFQAYLVDATGRKIAAIWGRGKEKELIADHILKCVNGQPS